MRPRAAADHGARLMLSRRDLLAGTAAGIGAHALPGALARAQVGPRWRGDALQRKHLEALDSWLAWLTEHQAQGYIGEFGFPAGSDFGAWANLARSYMRRLREAGGLEHGLGEWPLLELGLQPRHPRQCFAGSGY